jgi:centromeric protein E
MQNLKDEIQEKKRQMQVLERRMIGSIESSPNTANIMEMSQVEHTRCLEGCIG